MKKSVQFLLILVVLSAFSLVASGCRTSNPENTASRPWNSPRGWEHGLPSGINEGR